jgi:hypothetical protein
LCCLGCLLYERQIAVGEEAMPWMAIKLHIGAVRSLKDSDNGSTAAFGEITVFAERANTIPDMHAVRLLHCPLLPFNVRQILTSAAK